MSSVAVNTKDWVHIPTPTHGSLGELVRSIVQEVQNFERIGTVTKDSLYVNSAAGISLDAIGAIFNLERMDGETDTEYRARLIAEPSRDRQQTAHAIDTEVYRIAGCHPQIDDYPDVDFVTEYGMSKNEGIVRVLVPFNKWELWGDDISSRLPAVVAAGVAIIAESYNRYFEDFYDMALVSESYILHVTDRVEEEIPDRIAVIGSAVIGTHVLGGWTEVRYSEWDLGHWDEACWDGACMTVEVRDVL